MPTTTHSAPGGANETARAEASPDRPLILRSALLAKLASEEFEMDSPRSAQDAAYVRGWNDRSKSLARFLRGELTNQCGEHEEMESAFAHDGEGG